MNKYSLIMLVSLLGFSSAPLLCMDESARNEIEEVADQAQSDTSENRFTRFVAQLNQRRVAAQTATHEFVIENATRTHGFFRRNIVHPVRNTVEATQTKAHEVLRTCVDFAHRISQSMKARSIKVYSFLGSLKNLFTRTNADAPEAS